MRHSLLLCIALSACHLGDDPVAHPRPLPPPDARVAAAMASWGSALERGDDAALDLAEDRAGRTAFVYVGIKAVASQKTGGAKAVESTVAGMVILGALQSLYPGVFGPPEQVFFAFVPQGRLASGLVAAGLALPPGPNAEMVAVPVPWKETIGRVEEASQRHRERLRAAQAWTCKPLQIERSIPPTEPSLVRAAKLSTWIFADWLETVDAIWVVRARCATGDGWFVVTGHARPNGTMHDQILVANVASVTATPAETPSHRSAADSI